MPDVRASAEVVALIGTENLRELEGDAFALYDCARCGRRGNTSDTTSVVVFRYRDIAFTKLAHAQCQHSTVIDVDSDSVGSSLASGQTGMRAMTVILRYPDQPTPRPLLLLEPRVEPMTFTSGGERVNLIVTGMLERGFTWMLTEDQMPRLAVGWQLCCPDHYTALLLGPEREVVYRGGCAQPRQWAGLVDAAEACVVLVGTIGLYAVPDEELTAARLHQLLDNAARRGALAGGLVPCRRG